MAKAVAFDLKSREIHDVELDEAHRREEGLIHWVHLELDDDFAARAGSFGLGAEDIATIRAAGTQPEMEESEDALLLVLPYWSPSFAEGQTAHLVIHLTADRCLTACDHPLRAIRAFDRSYRMEFRYAQSPGFILFLVLEFLVEDYGTMVGKLDDEGQAFDDRIIGALDDDLNRDILSFKRRVTTLRRVAGHARSVIGRLAGRRIAVVSEACRESLADVGNEAQAVLTSVESLRDMADSAFDSYRSELAQRLNEIMKVLTMFSIAILPMTLIAGVYGMNFTYMPEIGWVGGYPLALALMLLSGIAILAFFKRKGWL